MSQELRPKVCLIIVGESHNEELRAKLKLGVMSTWVPEGSTGVYCANYPSPYPVSEGAGYSVLASGNCKPSQRRDSLLSDSFARIADADKIFIVASKDEARKIAELLDWISRREKREGCLKDKKFIISQSGNIAASCLAVISDEPNVEIIASEEMLDRLQKVAADAGPNKKSIRSDVSGAKRKGVEEEVFTAPFVSSTSEKSTSSRTCCKKYNVQLFASAVTGVAALASSGLLLAKVLPPHMFLIGGTVVLLFAALLLLIISTVNRHEAKNAELKNQRLLTAH